MASFGFLEDTLARTCFALTGSRECRQEDVNEAYIQGWIRSLEVSLYDNLGRLIKRIRDALTDDDRIPPEVGSSIVERLRNLSVWRNALCHGAWTDFDADGFARLRFFRKTNEGPEMLDDRLSQEKIARIRAEAIDLTILLMDVTRSIGVPFPGTAHNHCPGGTPHPPVQSAS